MKKLILVSMGLALLLAGGCGNGVQEPVPAYTLDANVDPASGGMGYSISENSEVMESEASEEVQDAPEESIPEEPEGPEVITITISAAGDCSLGNHQQQDYGNSFRQAYDNAEDDSYFFQNVKDIFAEDDMTIVNFEGVLTTSDNRVLDRTYNIKGDPGYIHILNSGNVEAVSFANNHRMDYGKQGSDDTVAAFEEAGIAYAYDDIVGIYETKGIKIGWVSILAIGSAKEKEAKAGIEKLQQEGCDLILVCIHWGIEKNNYIEGYQQKFGRFCLDNGADMVIGHHPHVLQGVEEYNGKYIIYSLANFCFGANRSPSDKDTMIFQQTFTFIDGEKQQDRNVKLIPCSVSSVKERNNFQPTPLEGEDALRVINRINTYSTSFKTSFNEDGTVN